MADADWTETVLARLPHRGVSPYEVTARLSRIGLHIARAQDESFARFGLNRGEVGVLGALLAAGEDRRLSPTTLFKGLMLSSAGITSRLDRLERRGYVRRTPHPEDRRGVLVELTDAGRKVLEQAVAADSVRESELVASLSKQQQRQLTALLKQMLSALEAREGRGRPRDNV